MPPAGWFRLVLFATVLSTSLSYALLFVGFVVATPWMLALSHLRREAAEAPSIR